MKSLKVIIAMVVFTTLCGCSTAPLRSQDDSKIEGKTYVITGASSGFGRGVALALGAKHANVVIAARRIELLNQVAEEISTLGGTPLVVTTDVSSESDMQKLADAAITRFGKIDVWINNAGVGAIGRFEEIPIQQYSRIVDVNLKGVIYGSHIAMHHFKQQGYGTLINIGSVESEIPLVYQSVYAATKAAVLSLGQSLNQQLRLDGAKQIKVVTVMPWAADTPFWQHAANYSGGQPRMAVIDSSKKVVNAIVRASVYPQDKVTVGWKAFSGYTSHRLFPRLSERLSADMAHKYQIETAPPAPHTSGSVMQPLNIGTEIEGGWRERMRLEDGSR